MNFAAAAVELIVKEKPVLLKFHPSTLGFVVSALRNCLTKRPFFGAVAATSVITIAMLASPGNAAVSVVNFETSPILPAGPSIYVAVPGPQTITTTPATFSGGVVLGFATFFPAISFATAPERLWHSGFRESPSEALTITVDPTFTTTEVSLVLFNGEVFSQSYSVNAFNGTALVGSQTLRNVAPNFNSGYGLIDLVMPGGITSVSIAPVGSLGMGLFH